MTTANEAWIQNSLARLEMLEQQRAQLADAGHADQLAELDEEIRTLYEALEAVAEESDGEDDAEAAPEATAPLPAVAVSVSDGSPFAPQSPMMGGALQQPAFAPMSDVSDFDFDDAPKSSKAPLIVAALVGVLAIVGIGGWITTQSSPAETPAPDPDAAKVITASEIPDDTQDPNVARGADADRTEGTRFKESSSPRRPSASTSRPRPASGSTEKPADKIELTGSRDPLAGVK
jgi:hypothetical protein